MEFSAISISNRNRSKRVQHLHLMPPVARRRPIFHASLRRSSPGTVAAFEVSQNAQLLLPLPRLNIAKHLCPPDTDKRAYNYTRRTGASIVYCGFGWGGQDAKITRRACRAICTADQHQLTLLVCTDWSHHVSISTTLVLIRSVRVNEVFRLIKQSLAGQLKVQK